MDCKTPSLGEDSGKRRRKCGSDTHVLVIHHSTMSVAFFPRATVRSKMQLETAASIQAKRKIYLLSCSTLTTRSSGLRMSNGHVPVLAGLSKLQRHGIAPAAAAVSLELERLARSMGPTFRGLGGLPTPFPTILPDRNEPRKGSQSGSHSQPHATTRLKSPMRGYAIALPCNARPVASGLTLIRCKGKANPT
jgi:hypothetical protein